jgi:glycerate-2-kinase
VVAKVHAAITKEIIHQKSFKKPIVLLSGGETTVTVKGNGKGGRNQEFVLSAILALEREKNFVVCAVNTDGIDGITDAAGAIADEDTIKRAKAIGLNPKNFLENNDSYNFFKPLGDLIFTGATGTNVNDVIVFAIT